MANIAVSVVDLLRYQVDRLPEKVALTFQDDHITYFELDSLSSQLATDLAVCGVTAGMMVGISMTPSIDLAIAIWAVLKVGAAYVPLDPTYPASRLEYMVGDAGIRIVLVSPGSVAHYLDSIRYISVDHRSLELKQDSPAPSGSLSGDYLAYVMYTSGSTGNPKGVLVSHESLVEYIPVVTETIGYAETGVYIVSASFNFALSVRQFFAPLCNGARLVIASGDQVHNPLELIRLIKKERVTSVDFVPSYFHACILALRSLEPSLRADYLENELAQITLVGEPLLWDLVYAWNHELRHPARITNLFGTTETLGIVCAYPIPTSIIDQQGVVPVGKPVPKTKILLLEDGFIPVSPGEIGDIFVQTPCLAKGYLHKPELTAEKFLPSTMPAESKHRMYRTGDLGRIRPDGLMEHLGRKDDQVKIHGVRIGTSEIEAKIDTFPGVSTSVVFPLKPETGEELELAACILRKPGCSFTYHEIREYLLKELPLVMIPTTIFEVDLLPHTPNGKLDRRKIVLQAETGVYHSIPFTNLSSMIDKGAGAEKDVFSQVDSAASLSDPTEREMTTIWERVLGKDHIDKHVSFFDLGGHSLLAIQLFVEIERVFHKRLPTSVISEASSIAALSACVDQWDITPVASNLVPIQTGGSKPAFYCVHGFGGGVTDYTPLSRLIGSDQPFYGLQARGLDGNQDPDRTIEEMAGHFVYDVLTFQPEGPYHLGGYCYGGIIAFEMARQLKAIGKTVGLVGLIDAYAPIHDSENFHILNLHHWQHFMANLSVYVRDLYRRGGNNHQPGFQQQLIRNMKIIANRFGVSVRRNPADVIGDESGAVPEHLFNLMQIEIDALNQYHPGRYDGTVTLFRVHRLSVIRGHDPDMGWGKFASSVKRIYTPGCHNNVLSDIYLVEFAKKLRSELEREYPPL